MNDTPGFNAVMWNNALKYMNDLGQQLPIIYGEMYSNAYQTQIHMFKQLSDASGVPYGKTAIHWWSQVCAGGASYNLDAYKKFLQWYSQVRLNGLRNMQEQIRILMEYYQKMTPSDDTPSNDDKEVPPKTVLRRKVTTKRPATRTVRRTRKSAK